MQEWMTLSPIDQKDLDYSSVVRDSDLSVIDPDIQDDFDSLGIRDFFLDKYKTFTENNLTTIWKVTYNDTIVAFFTLSMTAIENKRMNLDDRIDVKLTKYPAMLLGKIWVQPQYRGRKISSSICKFACGIATTFNESIACNCIVIQTDRERVPIYEKFNFVESKPFKNDRRIWMYYMIYL